MPSADTAKPAQTMRCGAHRRCTVIVPVPDGRTSQPLAYPSTSCRSPTCAPSLALASQPVVVALAEHEPERRPVGADRHVGRGRPHGGVLHRRGRLADRNAARRDGRRPAGGIGREHEAVEVDAGVEALRRDHVMLTRDELRARHRTGRPRGRGARRRPRRATRTGYARAVDRHEVVATTGVQAYRTAARPRRRDTAEADGGERHRREARVRAPDLRERVAHGIDDEPQARGRAPRRRGSSPYAVAPGVAPSPIGGTVSGAHGPPVRFEPQPRRNRVAPVGDDRQRHPVDGHGPRAPRLYPLPLRRRERARPRGRRVVVERPRRSRVGRREMGRRREPPRRGVRVPEHGVEHVVGCARVDARGAGEPERRARQGG